MTPDPRAADVTILIPHYQTLDAIRLCLRSIRRYTAPPYRVLVLDNGSTDASIDYLRSLGWIACLSTGVPNDLVSAQSAALNVGAARVETPLFLVMHSDTYVHRPGWLAFFRDRLQAGGYAALGTRHQTIRVYDSAVAARWAARAVALLGRIGRRETAAGVPWLRSCLTLYRTDSFRAAGCRFASDGREDATHAANAALAARGHRLLALPDRTVGYYVFHKGDTTRIANRLYATGDAEFRDRIARHRRHVGPFHARPSTQAILGDASLDR
jgi:glycosyltransferase involved in cell wall biosynthesis